MLYGNLSNLLLPPGGFFVLALIGAALLPTPWKGARWLLGTALALLYLSSIPFTSDLLLRALEARNVHDPNAEAIVVLGAGVEPAAPEYGGPTIDAMTLERVRYAAYLQKETGLPLLTSGGAASVQGPALADLMADILHKEFGADARWRESGAQTVAESAKLSAAILLPAHFQHIYLVTQAWHMPRAKLAFARAGFVVTPAGTGYVYAHRLGVSDFIPSGRAMLGTGYACHEMAGVIWYYLAVR